MEHDVKHLQVIDDVDTVMHRFIHSDLFPPPVGGKPNLFVGAIHHLPPAGTAVLAARNASADGKRCGVAFVDLVAKLELAGS